MRYYLKLFILIGLAFFYTTVPVFADEYANKRALADIKAVSVYYDVNMGIPAKLKTRLKLIDKTYDQLVEAGVRPEFVVGFRGKASYFVTKGNDYVLEEDLGIKREVQQLVTAFKAKGIVMEQCQIAAQLHHIEYTDFLPEVEVVQNGYISMIGYQAKGYSQVPMD
jgi:intracellular sulfur oxidation DsrE/DsrF family protein